MLLNLREIISIPGGKVLFDYTPNLSDAINESILKIDNETKAVGDITNRAGVLTFTADVHVSAICVCSRCLVEFKQRIERYITAYISDENEDGCAPDNYYLQGDEIDIDEIIVTEFILELEEKVLCREDCRGLCSSCGSDLNSGECLCEPDVDPRLEILQQFKSSLDN